MTTFDHNYQNSVRFWFLIKICQSHNRLKLKHSGSWSKMVSLCNCPVFALSLYSESNKSRRQGLRGESITWYLIAGKDGRKYLILIYISLTSRRIKTPERICLLNQPRIFLLLTFNLIKIDLISSCALISHIVIWQYSRTVSFTFHSRNTYNVWKEKGPNSFETVRHWKQNIQAKEVYLPHSPASDSAGSILPVCIGYRPVIREPRVGVQ